MDAIISDVKQRTYRGVLDSVFGQLAKHLGMPRWGDKTPDYNNHLEMLYELFPDAKYVHVVRDGRDVALSLQHVHFGPNSMFLAARDWQDQVVRVATFVAGLPNEQVLELRYEDLLCDPVGSFMGLADFLDVEDGDGELAASIEQHMVPKLNRANHDKWKSLLSESDREIFDRVAARELQMYGYETVVDEPGELPGRLRRALWYCEDKIHRWKRPSYWRENVYRAKVRGQDAIRTARSLFS